MHNKINYKINKMYDMNEQREREKYFCNVNISGGDCIIIVIM